MTFPPETEAAARAMYEAGKPEYRTIPVPPMGEAFTACRAVRLSWEELSDENRLWHCQSFVAGLKALIPVSDAMIRASCNYNPTYADAVNDASAITAAITYLTGDGK